MLTWGIGHRRAQHGNGTWLAAACAGVLKLKNKANIADFRPLDPDCSCSTCQRYTRAYLHNLVTRNIPSAAILVTYHNIAYTQVRREE